PRHCWRGQATDPETEAGRFVCLPIWSCSVRGFACRRCYQQRGALLPHLFTLTRLRASRRFGVAVCFLCHFPSGRPDRTLSGALPCGVRTFLPSTRRFRASLRAIVWLAANLHLIRQKLLE